MMSRIVEDYGMKLVYTDGLPIFHSSCYIIKVGTARIASIDSIRSLLFFSAEEAHASPCAVAISRNGWSGAAARSLCRGLADDDDDQQGLCVSLCLVSVGWLLD